MEGIAFEAFSEIGTSGNTFFFCCEGRSCTPPSALLCGPSTSAPCAQELPAYTGKLYRGIGIRLNEDQYQAGHRVCWAAFSSASTEKSVAEEFVKEGNGSLFILRSVGARPISKFSMFPEEHEVPPADAALRCPPPMPPCVAPRLNKTMCGILLLLGCRPGMY